MASKAAFAIDMDIVLLCILERVQLLTELLRTCLYK